MFKFWEYPISFQDPASVYAYHLFSVHNDVLWFILIILVLVYWCLYKIIRDFNWKFFNNQSGINLYIYTYVFIYVESYFIFYINKFVILCLKCYYDCCDLRELFFLGVCNSLDDYIFYLINFYINVVNFIFGIQTINQTYSSNLIDIEGKTFFDDEIFLSELTNVSIDDILNSSQNLSHDYIQYITTDRYVSSLLYHYTANAFFFNNRIDWSLFFSRKNKPFLQISNFAIFDIIELIIKKKINISKPTVIFQTDSVLRDTFFESQDFKHSLTFEFIWAIFPTAIILCILVPSLYLLYSLDEDLDPKLTIKVIGHQWYWSYEFNNWINLDNQVENFEFVSYKFDSNIILTDSLDFGTKRLLEVDKRLIVPINVTLRFLITSVMFYILELFLN